MQISLLIKCLVFLFCSLLLVMSVNSRADSCPVGQTWDDCSGPQFGGGGCIPGCAGVPSEPVIPNEPVGPNELCLPDCQPVTYAWLGNIVIAQSRLSNGYSVLGWSGPCFDPSCPDIMNQAWNDLRMNAVRANRAQRYE